MAKIRRKRKKTATYREKSQCRFCKAKTKYVDYMDLDTIAKLLSNRGKIFSRKRSGNCAKCQRMVQNAIKRARFMGLLAYQG